MEKKKIVNFLHFQFTFSLISVTNAAGFASYAPLRDKWRAAMRANLKLRKDDFDNDNPHDAQCRGRQRRRLTAPGRPAMTFEGLRQHVDSIGRQLAARGLGSGDRVAIVLPNGPEMASSFMAVTAYMSAAPLNPAYKESEYAFYLEDLAPKLVIVAQGSENPVRAAASALSIPVVEAVARRQRSGWRCSGCSRRGRCGSGRQRQRGLVLHTSGTTSRPKVVPLLQRNIIASTRNIAASIDLTAGDHCLNIMPLFHIHGLIAVLSTSMAQGASVCCTGGFNALKFLDQARDEKISWFSGVPTMHQAILLRAKRQAEVCQGSGSAACPLLICIAATGRFRGTE